MSTGADVEGLLRELAPQVLAALVRRFGDFADAEDAVQEALLAAATQWREDGLPQNPRGWLVTVAARRLTDIWRADAARRHREDLAAAREPAVPADVPDQDDSLALLFLCCHPVLSPGSAIPLTLRAVGGLSTAEIATAFMVPEDTMAKRISRAKQRIKTSDIPFHMPTADQWPGRLHSVLHVLYLIFNEGYVASTGPHVARTDLSSEAVRLTRALQRAPSSLKASRCSLLSCPDGRSASTSCRQPSPPSTTKPPPPIRPTGRRFSRFTACWNA